jgi:hypothetical protein
MHISCSILAGFGLSAKAFASCVCVFVYVRMDAMTGRCTAPSAASLATAWCNGLQSSCAHLQSSVEKLQASVTQRCVNSIPSKNVCVCVCVCMCVCVILGFPLSTITFIHSFFLIYFMQFHLSAMFLSV